MKWAKPLVRGARSQEQKMYDEKCFRFYTREEMKAKFGRKNVWMRHPFCFKFNSKDEYLKFQQTYEVFVGGYLYFYDEQNRSGAVDNVLFFEWSPFQKSADEYTVIIYLWPAPLRKEKGNSNGKTFLSKTVRTELKKANGQQLLEDAAPTMLAMMEADGGEEGVGDAIDPPPPPPPPPPPFQ